MILDFEVLGPFSLLWPSLDILPLPPPRLVAEPRARDSPLNRGDLEIASPLPAGRPKNITQSGFLMVSLGSPSGLHE